MVLSAYVQNYPIPAYLVDLIFVHLMDQTAEELDERMEGWELSTILWGFQYIDKYTTFMRVIVIVRIMLRCYSITFEVLQLNESMK